VPNKKPVKYSSILPFCTSVIALSFSAANAALLDGMGPSLRQTDALHLTPWSSSADYNSVADFLNHALPVAGNKADPANQAPAFFRVPALSTNDAGVILYVGLQAEAAPEGSEYRTPLFSGSIHSFRLGAAEAKPAPQTVGDIGEIFPEDAPPTPMAYIVYRLEFGTRNENVALFSTPILTPEPVTFTVSKPSIIAINASFVWDEIAFHLMPTIDDRDVDWQTERSQAGRLVPEPTALALLGAGLLGWAARRRRA